MIKHNGKLRHGLAIQDLVRGNMAFETGMKFAKKANFPFQTPLRNRTPKRCVSKRNDDDVLALEQAGVFDIRDST